MVNVVHENCPNCTTGRRYHATNGIVCIDCGHVEPPEYAIRQPRAVVYTDLLELANPELGAV
ncbi:MAG: hypothetical protein GWN94_24845 [Phycisphaerae bacterium]|nr:hypothetical protein [Phycisphaerae bacterium]NIP56324.1 hypothetical protein [Phycisphaerae bacterium]NIS54282.1 hypothetical protein [Phycisphaerae bacterium]NIX29847.1 hypothetical protein [Phycisphaerae bacterium]